MDHTETRTVQSKTVFCDGLNKNLGHPRVFLNMGEKNEVVCPYCSARFVLDPNAPLNHDSH